MDVETKSIDMDVDNKTDVLGTATPDLLGPATPDFGGPGTPEIRAPGTPDKRKTECRICGIIVPEVSVGCIHCILKFS